MTDLVSDKLKQGLAAFIQAVTGVNLVAGHVDFLALYPCAVATQNADGTLELKPDDQRLGPGFSSVPLRLGLPGTTVKLSTPTRCLVGWYGGDPSKPFAALFEGSTVTEIDFSATTIKLNGGSNGVARNGDAVDATAGLGSMGTWMGQVGAAINLLAPGSITPVTPTSFGKISAGSTSVKAG